MTSASRATGRVGVHLVGQLIEEQGWLFREQPVNDFGIDAHAEAPTSLGQPSGQLIALQIKAGETFFKEIRDEHIVYRGEARHRLYWTQHALPVVVVLCDPKSRSCFWQVVSERLIQPTEHGWTLAVPLSQRLGADAMTIWSRLVNVTQPAPDLLMQFVRSAAEVAIAKVGRKYRPELYIARPSDGLIWSFFDGQGETSKAMVLVERAGSGKTNLVCSISERLVAQGTPTVMLLGADVSEGRHSLVADVLKALGGDPGNAGQPAKLKDELLRLVGQRHLCVLVDAVNEARDPELMKLSLRELLAQLQGVRARILITCRDIYWSFVKAEWVDAMPCSIVSPGLYKFDEPTWKLVRKRYFEEFQISGALVAQAEDACRNPLLLRFFCEAYQDEDVGTIAEIRLKPLFEKYLSKKLEHLVSRGNGMWRAEESATQLLQAIAAEMLDTGTASIPEGRIPELSHDPAHRRRDSIYVRLLDEDILLDEQPDAKSPTLLRRVRFVYEAFFEFMLARHLEECWTGLDNGHVLKEVATLLGKTSANRNVLGALTYLDDFLERRRFPLWRELASLGPDWQRMVLSALREADPNRLPRQMCEAFPALTRSSPEDVLRAAVELLKSDVVAAQLDAGFLHLANCLNGSLPAAVRLAAADLMAYNWSALAPRARMSLLKAVLDPAADVRRISRQCLWTCSEEELRQLRKMLVAAARSESPKLRAAVMETLDPTRFPGIHDLIEDGLHDNSATVRRAALRHLHPWRKGVRMVLPSFDHLLDDTSPTVRRAALRLSVPSDLARRLQEEASPLVLRRLLLHVDSDSTAEVQAAVAALLRNASDKVRNLARAILMRRFGLKEATTIVEAFLANCGPLDSWIYYRWQEMAGLTEPSQLKSLLSTSFQHDEISPEVAAFGVGIYWGESGSSLDVSDLQKVAPRPLAMLISGMRRSPYFSPKSEVLCWLLEQSTEVSMMNDIAFMFGRSEQVAPAQAIKAILDHPSGQPAINFAWGLTRRADEARRSSPGRAWFPVRRVLPDDEDQFDYIDDHRY